MRPVQSAAAQLSSAQLCSALSLSFLSPASPSPLSSPSRHHPPTYHYTRPQQPRVPSVGVVAPVARPLPLPVSPSRVVCCAMTNYRNYRKTAKSPRRPYEKERLDRELKLVGEYGQRTAAHSPTSARPATLRSAWSYRPSPSFWPCCHASRVAWRVMLWWEAAIHMLASARELRRVLVARQARCLRPSFSPTRHSLSLALPHPSALHTLGDAYPPLPLALSPHLRSPLSAPFLLLQVSATSARCGACSLRWPRSVRWPASC